VAISKDKWLEAKALFEFGKSLTEIQDETGIDKSSVSKKAKLEKWEKSKNQQLKAEIKDFEKENSTLVEKKSTLVEKVSTLEDYEINILHNLIEDETRQKSIILSGLNLGAIRATQRLQNNKTKKAFKVKEGFGGGASSETIEHHDVELDSDEINKNIDTLIKIGKSLNFIDDKPTTQIHNTNAQQNNVQIEGYSVETIED